MRRLHHHLRPRAAFLVVRRRDGGKNVYLGNPLGLVLHFPDDKTLYHMGDTDIFSDMALINELHEPKIGIVPIGDRFTMGGAVAALACRRFFKFETVVPCHFGTFPILDQTADKFVAGMDGSASRWHCRRSAKTLEICEDAKGMKSWL